MKPLVYLIVLNYNMKKWLEQCLPSLLTTDYPNYKVVIVDNNSTDGSRGWVRERYPAIKLPIVPKIFTPFLILPATKFALPAKVPPL